MTRLLRLAMLGAVGFGFSASGALAQIDPPELHAVIVAVTAYSGNLPPTKTLGRAARDVEDAVMLYAQRAGFSKSRVSIDRLVDGQDPRPDRANVLTTLLKRGRYARGPQHTLVFYFTGHGSRDVSGNMILHASGADGVDSVQDIFFSDVLQRVHQSLAGTKLLFIDTCQILSETGILGGSSPSVARPLLGPTSLQNLVLPQGTAIFFSSKENEPSYIDRKVGIGYFTKHLLSFLWAHDTLVPGSGQEIQYADQLADLLRDRVSNDVVKSEPPPRVQEPRARLDVSGPLNLFPHRVSRAPTGSPPLSTARLPRLVLTREARAGERIMPAMVRVEVTGDEHEWERVHPRDFIRDVRGACLASNMTPGRQLEWRDLALCKN